MKFNLLITLVNYLYMPQLSITNKERIKEFFRLCKPSRLPHIDLKAKRNNTIKRHLNRACENHENLVYFGSDGANRSNHFLVLDGVLYVLTFDFQKLVEYAHVKMDYYD